MSSWTAFLTKQYIWATKGPAQWAPEWLVLRNTKNNWRTHNAPTVLPVSLTSDDKVKVEKEDLELAAKQKWEVHHISPSAGTQASKKVIVYFHGGAFIRPAKSQHWDFVRRLASELGIPVVVPHYTLLPLATGTQCTHAALDLCSRIMKDPRYKDKEIVVMGDSAGGWISMEVLIRLHQLSKSTSGQDTFGFNVEDGPRLIEKINQAILISAVVDFDWNQPEYDEAQRLDPWLSRTVLTPLIDIWAYGPKTTFPEYDFGLSSTEESRLTETSKEIPVTSPEHSPIAGIEFLQRRENGPVKILHFIGTADVLHPGAEMMQKRLDTMDSGVVQAETHIYDGLFHVFPLVPFLPEAQDAWRRIVAALV